MALEKSQLMAFANVAASSTDAAVVAAVTGRKIRVVAAAVSCGSTASTVTFNSKGAGSGTAVSATLNGSAVLPDGNWFQTNAGEGLTVTTGTGSTTGIQVSYALVS